MTVKPQRIRDPVHNLIEFGTGQLERSLWGVIQTPPFQRLRRIRQLGFSELVFPGATHTRFAHSLGVFHIARLLMQVIQEHLEYNHRPVDEHQMQIALAAALLHDVGHGMFSHAFEIVGKEFDLPMAKHEHVSAEIIRKTEISQALMPCGNSFAEEVATLVGKKGPGNLYDAVVSSQFDADRLDYMQRDRLMTGVRSSGVDQKWLIANLEVQAVPTGADDSEGEAIETLILGPKAMQTAESYLLSLFHLYPNVYLHKSTRGVEQLFTALIRRLIRLERGEQSEQIGLPVNHPIRRFINSPDKLDHALALDDGVFWGAIPMLIEAQDDETKQLARALNGRHLLKCIDIRQRLTLEMPRKPGEKHSQYVARVNEKITTVTDNLRQWVKDHEHERSRVMLDTYSRPPYKRYQDSDTPLNRVLIRTGAKDLGDLADHSSVIAGAQPFQINRAYVFRDDKHTETMVENEIRTSLGGKKSTPKVSL